VKKWEYRKWTKDRKVGKYKRFNFLSKVFGWENGKMKRLKTMENEVDINLKLCFHVHVCLFF